MQAEAKERGTNLSGIKCILRGKLVFGGFVQSSLFPPPEYVVFGSGPWLEYCSYLFLTWGASASCVLLSST